jgi:hypothetical protein
MGRSEMAVILCIDGRSRRVDLAVGNDISSKDAARDRYASTVFQDFLTIHIGVSTEIG